MIIAATGVASCYALGMTNTGTPQTPPATHARPGYKISSVTGKEYRMHGTTAKDPRGNPADRRRRRTWILSAAAGFGGNGATVPCVHCRKIVDSAGLHIDRITPGGTYRRDNIQPACRSCNLARGKNVLWTAQAA